MKTPHFVCKSYLYIFFFVIFILSCIKTNKKDSLLVVSENNANPSEYFNETRAKTPVKLAEGLEMKLWASDSLAPDPIAMSIDDAGAIYLSRTNRQKNSEFDIRGHQNWMTASIALQTVEDRRKFLKETFATSKSVENSWLKDLNEDGFHDWRDLAVEKEEVWKLEDRNKDGMADLSTRVFHDLNQEITDVAGAFMVRGKDAFLGAGPDMWRLTDKNGDGFYETKKSISHGYAVHIGFGGHGMSGVIEGPDGRIYWGIGDIGANLTAVDGKKYEYPNEGVIVRSNPDGTDFEVFASGLRNTHEFVFDQYGNIITEDNDGDHPGESERLMHVVEGLDAGWRANWQYGKYTDPKNNKYKVWMDERLYVPRWEGQAAYILPPIQNFHNGPTGMQFNPGTAFGKKWLNKFFIVEFVGSPSRSHIWSFGLKQKGASFVLDGEKDVLNGILPTGIKFGPDGAMYVADWINGWDTKNYGRVWKIDVNASENDLEELRKKTLMYMQLKYPLQTEGMLYELLAFDDMRIRQKAQFELVERGEKGFEIFKKTLEKSTSQLAKIHAIWGIGMLSRTNKNWAEILIPILKNGDAELVAQAAKTLGDLRYSNTVNQLIELLEHENARVKFYAAEALGRIGDGSASIPLIEMLEKNNDEDLYLRHSAVLALSRIKAEKEVIALVNNKSKALRTAAVLVLRKLKSDKIALFLNDTDEYIVTEVARAINDDLSIPGAFSALIKVLENEKFSSEPLMRRAINVALRLGTPESLNALIVYSKKLNISDALRAEAIATLGSWAEPSVLDRVDGRYRGIVLRDLGMISSAISPHVSQFLEAKNPATQIAIIQLLSNLKISSFNEKLVEMFNTSNDIRVKVGCVETLSALNYSALEVIIKKALADEKSEVRAAAIGSLPKILVSESQLDEILKPIFEKGSIREKQRLVNTLASLPISNTKKVLNTLIDLMANDKLDKELLLDLTETINKSGSEPLIQKLKTLKKGDSWLDEFKASLFGGDSREGRNIFNYNSTAQCVRCHSLSSEGTGAIVGPNLRKIGSSLSREIILEALVNPSGRLSPGYGQVNLVLKDGTEIMGTIASENDNEIVLTTSDAEPTKVAISRISKRENMPSSMPAMGDILSKREIRDLVEFLAGMK